MGGNTSHFGQQFCSGKCYITGKLATSQKDNIVPTKLYQTI